MTRTRIENKRIVYELEAIASGDHVGLMLAELGTKALSNEGLQLLADIATEQRAREDAEIAAFGDEEDDYYETEDEDDEDEDE